MAQRVTATEAARNFSEILNSVKYKRARYLVSRGGKAVAQIVPPEREVEGRKLGDLPGILKRLPRLGSERGRFSRDLEELAARQSPVPDRSPWD